MPELPEVETMKKELDERVRGRTFLDVWTDAPKLIHHPSSFSIFKKALLGHRLEKVTRKGKLLIFHLSRGQVLIFHPKMTGHFLLGHWQYQEGRWQPELSQQYIHVMFYLDKQMMLGWSDLRKFSRIELWLASEQKHIPLLENIGLDALSPRLSFSRFAALLHSQRKPIKVALMEQSLISGIGNIYSSEILWQAKIYPGRKANSLTLVEMKKIYESMKKILREAVKLKGTGIVDFRDLDNDPGQYVARLKVYRRAGQPCPRCGHLIQSLKLGGRTAYYCPYCQPKQ